MGGCVSVEALYTKMMAKSSGTFKLYKTEVTILQVPLPNSGVETITIPMFEEAQLLLPMHQTNLAESTLIPAPPIEQEMVGSVLNPPKEGSVSHPQTKTPIGKKQDAPDAHNDLQQSQNEGPNKLPHRIPYNKLCSAENEKDFKAKVEQRLTDTVLFQLKEKKISHAECDGIGFNIKNLLFVLVDKSPNFLKDRLPGLLHSLYARAELMHYPSIAIPALHNSSVVGCAHAEVAQATASATVAYLSKPSAIDAKTLSRIYFVSTDDQFVNELKSAFQSQVEILKSRQVSQEGKL